MENKMTQPSALPSAPAKKVYVSLPITGHDLVHVRNVAAAHKRLLEKEGYQVITPFDVNPNQEASYAACLGRDVEFLLECDALYLCLGWEDSKGCTAEYHIARIYEKEIIFWSD